MELTKERFIIILISGVVIVSLGLYLVVYRPVIIPLKTTYSQLKRCQEDLTQARSSIASLKRGDIIKKALMTEEDISLAIDELTKEGKTKNINFISMTPKKIEPKKDSQHKILPIEMEIESTYEELGVFLGSLDDLQNSIVTIRSFKVTPSKEDPTKLKTNLVVNMSLSSKNAE